jgi:hypothetical protein
VSVNEFAFLNTQGKLSVTQLETVRFLSVGLQDIGSASWWQIRTKASVNRGN